MAGGGDVAVVLANPYKIGAGSHCLRQRTDGGNRVFGTAERDGLDRRSAVEQAVRRRLRPILMTTLTSIFGMLPLLLIPGPGSEVYQGLAAVIVGGMAVSTLFTLIFLPSLLRLGETRKSTSIVAGDVLPVSS